MERTCGAGINTLRTESTMTPTQALIMSMNMTIQADMQEVLDNYHGWKRQLIIELKTSAPTPEHGDIIRFHAINRWDPDDEFEESVKPSRPLSRLAEEITGMTNERLAGAGSRLHINLKVPGKLSTDGQMLGVEPFDLIDARASVLCQSVDIHLPTT